MTEWNLNVVLHDLHKDIQGRLSRIRKMVGHSGSKGDASEKIWLDMFSKYLPSRYKAESAFVVDSKGVFSQQIDVVIFDRHYTPFILDYEGQKVIPAESVYAVFECKQELTKDYVKYARDKVKSVRDLYRTSLPIPHAGGTFPAKALMPILGGVLTLDSSWSPPLGNPFLSALSEGEDPSLDLGCIASHGFFFTETKTETSAETEIETKVKTYVIDTDRKAATGFLFKLISELQKLGTVPMIDVEAYAEWLTE